MIAVVTASNGLLEAETGTGRRNLATDFARPQRRMAAELIQTFNRYVMMNFNFRCSRPLFRKLSLCSSRRGMSRVSVIAGALLWSLVGIGLLLVWKQRQPEANGDESAKPTEQTSESSVKLQFPARRLPDFEFDEVMGGELSLDDLKGTRWVASFVFSRCTTSCPMISAAMMRLHEKVEKTAPEVKFVSITVDPKFDTADVFRQYSEIWTKGNHERWKFLTGSKAEIYDLVVKGFGLYVKENVGETRLPGMEVAHTNRVVLVNEDGIPVGTFLGTREADMVKLRRILNGRDPFPTPGPALTFSSGDGSPLAIEFQAVPAGDDKAADQPTDELDPETPAESEVVDPESSADAAAVPPSAVPTAAANDDANNTDAGAAPEAGAAGVSAVRHNASIDAKLPDWARSMPHYNAALNSLATILLFAGFIAIRSGRRDVHRNLMIAAFVTSSVFLVNYLTYHWALGEYTGEHGKRFTGEGVWSVVYPLILWPHIVLAACVPVLAILVFRHAFAARWEHHRRLARITFPIWMFVSITGVVIYAMLYHWPNPVAPADTIALATP